MGSLRLKDNKDEDLALFREMRRREKERNDLLLLQNSDEFDAPLGILKLKFTILFFFSIEDMFLRVFFGGSVAT